MRTRVTYSARFFAHARAEMLMHDLPFYSTIGTMKIDFSLKDMKQKMAGMTAGQKADYIWTYYKVPILAAAFILIFTFSLVSAIMKNTLSDPVLSYGVVERADVHCGEALDQIAAEAFPASTGFHAPERCSITSPADENNPYGPVQLAALVSAGDLDAILADKAIADYLVEGGAALSVTDISGTAIGRRVKEFEVPALYFVVLSKGEEADASEKNAEKRKAAEHFLEVIQGM